MPYTGTEQQLFLYGYRATVFSYYMSLRGHDVYEWMLSHDYSETINEHIEMMRIILPRIRALRLREQELAALKSEYDANLRIANFDDLRNYVVEIDQRPPVMCAFARGPVFDFSGQVLQSLTDSNPKADTITCTLTATNSGGAIIFTWLGDSDVNERFVSSLDALDDAELSSAVVRYVFNCSGNLFASPLWWDALDADIRERLRLLRMGPGPGKVTVAEYVKTPYRYQKDLDLMPVQWGIISRTMTF